MLYENSVDGDTKDPADAREAEADRNSKAKAEALARKLLVQKKLESKLTFSSAPFPF